MWTADFGSSITTRKIIIIKLMARPQDSNGKPVDIPHTRPTRNKTLGDAIILG